MPRVRVPVRRSGYRYTARPGRRYPVAPVAPARGGKGLLGGLAGLLLCLLCLATLGLLGLFAAFIAVTAYLGDVYRALKSAGGAAPGLYVNMAVLFAALFFAVYHKLQRSL
ncbi:unnamed protein product [Adineta steineri]|uniref:Uncharacterized protein n=1 Tax=Adineta steineri TaxID=433720 RepID=A0A815B0N5_9BILA|nr:unnamed protein product [Adineta steineri]CAF1263375.1 unnamed protein product [Adineta steineri]CAF1297163.1 unnamed protein product [Adineta steineri]CAF1329348.1 unnamed protein product [Adineta steineri]CAF1440545.1 unnamed protein product [Adineta steineri]